MLIGLLAMVLLSHLNLLAALSQAIEEFAMTAQAKQTTFFAANLKPADPAHRVALFALG